ncbi:uncharacterized protein [Neodiprion pinetum]|uniref:uncharacterized protein LOC124182147 n=1 Tax=Neodiprion fabricii TaxID=2872261 RepID=UPI001ED976D1|nr:uncharacterized protein LOC124182147 [Neodiprion fabricii]XP_046485102.1 uncharacterized protein LOC124220371 [Neodiprion pinetum]
MAARLFKSLLLGNKSNGCSGYRGKALESTRLFPLRDSRWFTKKEYNLFENVLDSGYILELRATNKNDGRNVNKDIAATVEYGIVLWIEQPAGEKKEAMVVHLVKANNKYQNKGRGIIFSTLQSFWADATEIRINNTDDSKESPNASSIIIERINCASKGSYKWTASRSFVRWCRYGHSVPDKEIWKRREMQNAVIRWGSVSASAGALLYLSKQQRHHSAGNHRA